MYASLATSSSHMHAGRETVESTEAVCGTGVLSRYTTRDTGDTRDSRDTTLEHTVTTDHPAVEGTTIEDAATEGDCSATFTSCLSLSLIHI